MGELVILATVQIGQETFDRDSGGARTAYGSELTVSEPAPGGSGTFLQKPSNLGNARSRSDFIQQIAFGESWVSLYVHVVLAYSQLFFL